MLSMRALLLCCKTTLFTANCSVKAAWNEMPFTKTSPLPLHSDAGSVCYLTHCGQFFLLNPNKHLCTTLYTELAGRESPSSPISFLYQLPHELPTTARHFSQLAQSSANTPAAGAEDGVHIWMKTPGNRHHSDYMKYIILRLSICKPSVMQ